MHMGIALEKELLTVRLQSDFGSLGIVWKIETSPIVKLIFLPGERMKEKKNVKIKEIPLHGAPPPIRNLSRGIANCLKGNAVTFDLKHFDLAQCSRFQQGVLLAEFHVPRGCVTTYGRIAAHLGMCGAARAVGNALGANPFPIVIPCHRAIRSDGSLGGYRGGARMKRKLLEMEGVKFNNSGRVLTSKIFY